MPSQPQTAAYTSLQISGFRRQIPPESVSPHWDLYAQYELAAHVPGTPRVPHSAPSASEPPLSSGHPPVAATDTPLRAATHALLYVVLSQPQTGAYSMVHIPGICLQVPDMSPAPQRALGANTQYCCASQRTPAMPPHSLATSDEALLLGAGACALPTGVATELSGREAQPAAHQTDAKPTPRAPTHNENRMRVSSNLAARGRALPHLLERFHVEQRHLERTEQFDSNPPMPKAYAEWTVLPHEPMLQLADNLLWLRGSLPGMSLRRVMLAVRLSAGRLLIYNGIAVDDSARAQLEAFGEPTYLIVPNGGHRLDAPAYKQRYPALRVFAPKGGRTRVAQVVPVDGDYEEFPQDETVRFETLRGVNETEGVMIVRSSDGTSVVLNDLMFNMDTKRDLLGYVFTTVFGSAPGPRVSRLAKLIYVKDKKALRADFERLAELPGLTRVIVAHDKVASGADARAALLQAATYL